MCRPFCQTSTIALLAIVLSSCAGVERGAPTDVSVSAPVEAAKAPQSAHRNVVFIAVDDLRNWVGYTGDYAGTIHTPNIDALAAKSTRYLNAYATVPQCTGSRTSVMLGLRPETHGITGLSWGTSDTKYNSLYKNPSILSLPEAMNLNGYYTAGIGKIFNSPYPHKWKEHGPPSRLPSNYKSWDLGPDGTLLNPGLLPAGETHTDQLSANWASAFIENYARPEPFFLAVGFFLPHVPWTLPQWAYDLYPIDTVVAHTPIPGDLNDEPSEAVELANSPVMPNGLSQYEAIVRAGKVRSYTQAYLAAISHTDAMIGQVLKALAASSYAGNTDVILWSDQGYNLGEKFHWGKNSLWEDSLKVPLLISSPGNPHYPVGDVTRNVSLLDLAPTVLDLAGLPPFRQFEGKPLYRDDGENRVFAYWGNAKVTLANGWKVIDYDLSTVDTIDDMAAYFLEIDPEEIHNQITPEVNASWQRSYEIPRPKKYHPIRKSTLAKKPIPR